ncbi:MAG TPA: hypothetical protein VLH56_08530 [Dissulfurispiraceae bacterium]|nr:hypothetical protein [Dissulfurispiraceae bacterium]
MKSMKSMRFKIGIIIFSMVLSGAIAFGEYLGAYHLGDTVSIYKFVYHPLTGLPITGHGGTFGVFHVQDRQNPIIAGHMDQLGELHNNGYILSFLLTEALGFQSGELYHVYYRVIIDGLTYSSSDSFQILHAAAGIQDATAIADILSRQIWRRGAIEFRYEVRQPPIVGVPIPDVSVWVTTDAEGKNVIHSAMTNQFGIANFWIDAGTSYFWRHKTGFNFINPDLRYISE